MNYKKAPQFDDVIRLFKTIVYCDEPKLSAFVAASIKSVCDYLEIKTQLLISSNIEQNRLLHGQDRVLDICHSLKATEYYNAIGGQALYSKEDFRQNGLELRFLQSDDIVYKQFGNDFTPGLSILDILMFSIKDEIKKMLQRYTLISHCEF